MRILANSQGFAFNSHKKVCDLGKDNGVANNLRINATNRSR